jgi:hypothetical protein
VTETGFLTCTVIVSALERVAEREVEVAVSKFADCEIVAVNEQVPLDFKAVIVELLTEQESGELEVYVTVPDPEPSDTLEISVKVLPYFTVEADIVSVIVRGALAIVSSAEIMVVAVYESLNVGTAGVIV